MYNDITINKEDINEYEKYKKEFIKIRETDINIIKNGLKEGKNLYAYSYCIEEDCSYCGEKNLNIVDSNEENGFTIITVYCENCHEYIKYYIKDKRVDKTEHFVENIKNSITNKDRKRFNIYKTLKKIDYKYDIFMYDYILFIYMGLLFGGFITLLTSLILKNFTVPIGFGMIIFLLFIIFATVFNVYDGLRDKIDRKKFFYLSHENLLIGENIIVLHLTDEELQQLKKNKIMYSEYYLTIQRQQVELLRQLKIYNVLSFSNKPIIENYEAKINKFIKNSEEEEAKALYIELHDLEKINKEYLLKIKEIKELLKNNYEELLGEKKKLDYYYLDVNTQRLLLDKDELEMLEIDSEFENYKNKILSSNH